MTYQRKALHCRGLLMPVSHVVKATNFTVFSPLETISNVADLKSQSSPIILRVKYIPYMHKAVTFLYHVITVKDFDWRDNVYIKALKLK